MKLDQLRSFEAVARIDPNDAEAWYYRGKCVPNADDAKEAKEYFEKAVTLNPYLNAARYALAQHGLTTADSQKKLLDAFQELLRSNAQDLSNIKYTEMGRYAEVIGKSPAPPSDTPPPKRYTYCVIPIPCSAARMFTKGRTDHGAPVRFERSREALVQAFLDFARNERSSVRHLTPRSWRNRRLGGRRPASARAGSAARRA